MLTTERLLRVLIELIFVLLGLLVIWLGLAGYIFFNRHNIYWPALSVILILWSIRVLYRPASRWSAWENRIRGSSLLLVGLLLLAIAYVPFPWVGRLLALAGLMLVLRGIVSSVLILRAL
jgi:hypothetical protein